MNHLASHIHHPDLHGDNTLHVIGVISNYVRWHSRYRLARQWKAEMEKTPNVKCYIVECAYGNRKFEVTDHCNPRHLQVRTHSEIWNKENLINLAVARLLPKNWKYISWCDMDVSFRDDKGWAQATLHQLQHYHIVQPWSQAVDLDFHGGIHSTFTSFGYLCANDKPMWHGKNNPGYQYAHTGFSWACTRYFWENLRGRGLLDFSICGAGDHAMAWGCIGKIREVIHKGMSEDYFRECEDWARPAQRACASMVGYVHGRIEHHHHGPKAARGYWSRWNILTRNEYEPTRDLAYDCHGVIQLCGSNKYKLEHDISRYNRSRCEDSLEQY